jgi:hypothetical protein
VRRLTTSNPSQWIRSASKSDSHHDGVGISSGCRGRLHRDLAINRVILVRTGARAQFASACSAGAACRRSRCLPQVRMARIRIEIVVQIVRGTLAHSILAARCICAAAQTNRIWSRVRALNCNCCRRITRGRNRSSGGTEIQRRAGNIAAGADRRRETGCPGARRASPVGTVGRTQKCSVLHIGFATIPRIAARNRVC